MLTSKQTEKLSEWKKETVGIAWRILGERERERERERRREEGERERIRERKRESEPPTESGCWVDRVTSPAKWIFYASLLRRPREHAALSHRFRFTRLDQTGERLTRSLLRDSVSRSAKDVSVYESRSKLRKNYSSDFNLLTRTFRTFGYLKPWCDQFFSYKSFVNAREIFRLSLDGPKE